MATELEDPAPPRTNLTPVVVANHIVREFEELARAWDRLATSSGPSDAYPASRVYQILSEAPFAIPQAEARSLMPEGDPLREINKQQFFCILAALRGSPQIKATVAFNKALPAGKGHLTIEDFSKIARILIDDDDLVKRLAGELDSDGSEKITMQMFINFLPEGHEAHPRSYSVHSLSGEHRAASVRYFKGSRPKASGGAKLNASDLANAARKDSHGGTSPLQMQIGLFRLLQGAAYRCFRASYSANCETHLRAYDLPYTISGFVDFVGAALDLYIGLGILEDRPVGEAEALRECLLREFQQLQNRMQSWQSLEKTSEMAEAEAGIDEETRTIDNDHNLFASVLELILSLGINDCDPYTTTHDALAAREIGRLRLRDEFHELSLHHDSPASGAKDPEAYLRTWQRVIMDDTDTHYEGAIMPTAFWYEEFMPRLLRLCSATTNAELDAIDAETAGDLDEWFRSASAKGEFDPFAKDVKEKFESSNFKVKQEIKQAWRLSRHYLNGVQKRREREEFGRNDGYLSEYVAFIDAYLGRSDVRDSEMRISFPYFIGPATWRFMHTCAEIINALDSEDQPAAVDLFRAFFKSLAAVYPCPYCRFHLNRYVVRNKELTTYPIEYLLLGVRAKGHTFEVSLDDKLSTVDSAEKLRLFLWKLHNTVSSSITRTEAWFHKDENAYYTPRYWPSMEAELVRARTLSHRALDVERIIRVYEIMKPTGRLAMYRDEFQNAVAQNDDTLLASVWDRFDSVVGAVEAVLLLNRFLEEAYAYDPKLNSAPPHFTPEEESLARSGFYVEA